MTTYTTADFVAYMQRICDAPNVRYGSWDCPNRCEPFGSGCSDCSGSICDALQHCGLPDFPCTGSFDLSRQLHRAGAGIRLEDALPGDLLFIGMNEGQGRLDGSLDGVAPGHVAVVKSMVTRRTLECRNHLAGCLEGPVDGRGWDYCARNIWLPQPSVPPPVVIPKEYEDMLIYAPPRQQKQGSEQPAFLHLDIEQRLIVGHNGARIKERTAVKGDGFTLKLKAEPVGWCVALMPLVVNGKPVLDDHGQPVMVPSDTILVALKGTSDKPIHLHFA